MCTHTYTHYKPVGVVVVVEDIPGSKREKEGIKEGSTRTLKKDVAVLATNLLWRVGLEEYVCVCVCERERDMGCTNLLTEVCVCTHVNMRL